MENYPGYILASHIPSRNKVIQFTEGLIDYLFPVVEDAKEFLKKHDSVQLYLKKQLFDILKPISKQHDIDVMEITSRYFDSLEEIKDTLIKDANLILEFDPAAYSLEEVILSYPGFSAIIVHRLSHELYKLKVPLIPRMMSEWAHSKTGIDINPGATIDSPFFIDHGTGLVIGETTVIGKNVKIYQGVTLGALAVKKEDAQSKRHPTIEDNVVIYAGSTILGGNTVIGHDSIIGGNTWITESILPFSIVYHKDQTTVKDRKDFNEPINFII
ncbi:MAG: serine acetyltransferase [Sphingobacteriales bacterium]|nr:MAG: serine acetyltransferase [Sphingobacteriales bacterium]